MASVLEIGSRLVERYARHRVSFSEYLDYIVEEFDLQEK